MSQQVSREALPAQTRRCPPWCVAPHGLHEGEEDWVHLGEPMTLVEGLPARLCMSVDPHSDIEDGPYVLIGTAELAPAQAHDIGLALVALAGAASSTTAREEP